MKMDQNREHIFKETKMKSLDTYAEEGSKGENIMQ